MSSFMAIDFLQPGDSLNVRFAFSLATQDGTVPLFPAEALVVAMEQDFLPIVIPEPSALLLICIATAGLLRSRQDRRGP